MTKSNPSVQFELCQQFFGATKKFARTINAGSPAVMQRYFGVKRRIVGVPSQINMIPITTGIPFTEP
jgi:hypothetical protein